MLEFWEGWPILWAYSKTCLLYVFYLTSTYTLHIWPETVKYFTNINSFNSLRKVCHYLPILTHVQTERHRWKVTCWRLPASKWHSGGVNPSNLPLESGFLIITPSLRVFATEHSSHFSLRATGPTVITHRWVRGRLAGWWTGAAGNVSVESD